MERETVSKHTVIGPKEFKQLYAPTMGIESVRSLFKTEGFPSFTTGTGEPNKRVQLYTTVAAAEKWLEEI